MSHAHTKTNYVSPICGYKENTCKNLLSDAVSERREKTLLYGKAVSYENFTSLKNVGDSKQKYVSGINSSFSSLFDEIKKLQQWKTSLELDNKQKEKRQDELLQIVESQRKVVLDLQMQNENLSSQINEEINHRASTLEKFFSTKELCSALKRRFDDLQEHFEYGKQIQEIVKATDAERLNAIKSLEQKFIDLCKAQSEEILQLNDALKSEEHKASNLKEVFDEQIANTRREVESLRIMLTNKQAEISEISLNFESEKHKSDTLIQEKDDLENYKIQLEKMTEFQSEKLKELEVKLKVLEADKLETESNYLTLCSNMEELKKRYEELEDSSKRHKTESDKENFNLQQTVLNLQNFLSEAKEKLLLTESKNENLVSELLAVTSEKNNLEQLILHLKSEKTKAEEKSEHEFEALRQKICESEHEKNNLNLMLEEAKENLIKMRVEKDDVLKLKCEKEEQLLQLNEKYRKVVTESENLTFLENENSDMLLKIKALEEDLRFKSKQFLDKDKDYSELLLKVKELEDDLRSKSELLVVNDKKYAELLQKVKNLEEDLHAKSELLSSSNENCVQLSGNIKELNEILKSKTEFLAAKELDVLKIQNMLEKKEIELEKLQYENIELREKIKSEKESIKICLDCELLKEKEKEVEELKTMLQKAENDVAIQKSRRIDLVRMLEEAEKNHNRRRIMDETEINDCKARIHKLEEEYALFKYQTKMAKQQENKEVISNQNEVIIVEKDVIAKEPKNKNEHLNKIEVTNNKKMTVNKSELLKRNWETESSGSEYFELSIDKESSEKKTLTPRRKPLLSKNLNLISSSRNEIQRKKMNLSINKDHNSPLHPLPLSKRRLLQSPSTVVKENQQTVFEDFVCSKANHEDLSKKRQVNPESSILTTPKERKFFKTPLKCRESKLKNMQPPE